MLDIKNIEDRHYKSINLLDDYDHQNIKKKENIIATYELRYEEAKFIIKKMMYNNRNDLFGLEKDESFKSSIELINQKFNEEDIYYSLEEKAANLLYLIVKNHSFVDGNKRIAAEIFLYFLYKNKYFDLEDCNDFTSSELSTIIIMIALSNPNDKNLIINYITNII